MIFNAETGFWSSIIFTLIFVLWREHKINKRLKVLEK